MFRQSPGRSRVSRLLLRHRARSVIVICPQPDKGFQPRVIKRLPFTPTEDEHPKRSADLLASEPEVRSIQRIVQQSLYPGLCHSLAAAGYR
jgi:hypothetical protein